MAFKMLNVFLDGLNPVKPLIVEEFSYLFASLFALGQTLIVQLFQDHSIDKGKSFTNYIHVFEEMEICV